jgi:hypothetical protein
MISLFDYSVEVSVDFKGSCLPINILTHLFHDCSNCLSLTPIKYTALGTSFFQHYVVFTRLHDIVSVERTAWNMSLVRAGRWSLVSIRDGIDRCCCHLVCSTRIKCEWAKAGLPTGLMTTGPVYCQYFVNLASTPADSMWMSWRVMRIYGALSSARRSSLQRDLNM